MNLKSVTIATALAVGVLGTFGVMKLAPPVAAAQAISPLAAARLNALEKRVAILENQTTKNNQAASNGGQLRSGTTSAATSAAAGNAQINQVVELQNQVNTLQTQLQKLQTQFAKHYHTYTTTPSTGSEHGVLTILNCQGYGKACTAATSETEITVFVPPNVQTTPSPYTIQTSGPVLPTN